MPVEHKHIISTPGATNASSAYACIQPPSCVAPIYMMSAQSMTSPESLTRRGACCDPGWVSSQKVLAASRSWRSPATGPNSLSRSFRSSPATSTVGLSPMAPHHSASVTGCLMFESLTCGRAAGRAAFSAAQIAPHQCDAASSRYPPDASR